MILILSLIRGLLTFGQTYFGEKLSQAVAYDLRNRFYNHIQHLSFEFHDTNHTGNLMSRAITDVEAFRMFIMAGLVRSPYYLILFFASSTILIWRDWRLGLVALLFIFQQKLLLVFLLIIKPPAEILPEHQLLLCLYWILNFLLDILKQ